MLYLTFRVQVNSEKTTLNHLKCRKQHKMHINLLIFMGHFLSSLNTSEWFDFVNYFLKVLDIRKGISGLKRMIRVRNYGTW